MRLTMSKAAIPLYCVWPFANDREAPVLTDKSGSYRLFGQAFHGVVAKLINTGEYDASAEVRRLQIPGDYHENCASIIRMFPMDCALDVKNAHPDARAEVSYAFDPTSGAAIELGVDIERQYQANGASPEHICGSADVVWTENDPATMSRMVVVRDWKVVFGKGMHVEPAASNPQAHWLALCAMRALGINKARVEIAYVSEFGDVRIDAATVSQMRAAMTVRRVLDAIRGAETSTPRQGRHCLDNYCPMLTVCPAIQESVQLVCESVTHLPTIARLPIVADASKIKSDDHAAYLLTMARQVDRACTAIVDACKSYVRSSGHDLDMGNGMMWGPTKTSRSAIVADSVGEMTDVIATYVGGLEKARQLVKIGITKSALETAISGNSRRGETKSAMRQCLADLETAGMVVSVATGEKFEERKKQ